MLNINSIFKHLVIVIVKNSGQPGESFTVSGSIENRNALNSHQVNELLTGPILSSSDENELYQGQVEENHVFVLPRSVVNKLKNMHHQFYQ